MKRDPEYLREILLEMEASNSSVEVVRHYIGMGQAEQKRWHHFQLLCDAGLITQVSGSGFRLTSQGHDFLDAIRDQGRWRKIMDRIRQSGGDWTMEILKTLALRLLNENVF